MGFVLVNGFIDHLYTWLGTTSSYSVIANLYTLQMTTTQAKHQSFIAFLSHCLITAFNGRDSSASVLTPLHSGLILLTTELIASAVSVIISQHGPHRKHHVYDSNSIIASIFIAAGMCLPSRCPELVIVYTVTTWQHVYMRQYITLHRSIWQNISNNSYST
jgi:hypothetical protein